MHMRSRDPGAEGYFWCYTTDPRHEWGPCAIQLCPGKLLLANNYIFTYYVEQNALCLLRL